MDQNIDTSSAEKQLHRELVRRQDAERLFDREMAERLRVSVGTWSSVARGQTRITPHVARQAARAFEDLAPLAEQVAAEFVDWRARPRDPEALRAHRRSRKRIVA